MTRGQEVQAVAIIMCKACGKDPYHYDPAKGNDWFPWMEYADAAVAALDMIDKVRKRRE